MTKKQMTVIRYVAKANCGRSLTSMIKIFGAERLVELKTAGFLEVYYPGFTGEGRAKIELTDAGRAMLADPDPYKLCE